jgi:hypothetical protein
VSGSGISAYRCLKPALLQFTRETSVLTFNDSDPANIGALLPDSDPEFFFLPDPDPFLLRTKHEKS